MILFRESDKFYPLLAEILGHSYEQTAFFTTCWGFEKNKLIAICYHQSGYYVHEHEIIHNINTSNRYNVETYSIGEAVAHLSEMKHYGCWIPTRHGPVWDVNWACDPDNKTELISPYLWIPFLQMIANTKVNGDEIQQSLNALYDKEPAFKFTRLYLSGGLKVQKKTEAGPVASNFEDMVTYYLKS